MDIIHLLPDSVANQIAAGEVIQRPASVIKELMENAVDAGATKVDVVVEDAGRTSIRVIDNGKGMSETDARLAFERHATSKIQKAEDLFSLRTMGFRGEALPSIAAVAQVRLTTRTFDHELGTRLCIEGSKVISQDICSCPSGADFEIRNLFFNIPARRKFLKSNQTELNNIIQEFERIALVNPSVDFSLMQNGTLVTQLQATNTRQRIQNIFGKKLGEQLLNVEVDTSLLKIRGFVGKPESAKKKGAQQYFFVNGRYMRHPYFHKAVMEAFEQMIPTGEQIPYFIYFQVDPANIDVNIHPTKTEIKFEDENSIWQIIVASIRETLGRFNAIPTLDFDTEGKPDIPVFTPNIQDGTPKAPRLQTDPTYNPFNHHSENCYHRETTDWDKLYAGVEKAGAPDISLPAYSPDMMDLPLENTDGDIAGNGYFQYLGSYILTAVRSGLMFIDQHRAHIRILYDSYMKQMEGQSFSTQGLLFPEMVQFSPSDAILLQEMTDELHALGFDITSLGGGSFSIQGVPQGIEGLDPATLLADIVVAAREETSHPGNDIQHTLALTMAHKTAIISGQILSHEEMDKIVGDLFASTNPNYTPDGKPILTIMEQEKIEKMF